MMQMKTAIVTGAGGFIGSHLVKRLKREGYFVRGIDVKFPEYSETEADEFIIQDLADLDSHSMYLCFSAKKSFDEVYALAADMGGAGYIFTKEHDADIMSNSALCNLNTLKACKLYGIKKVFFSSSACIYPEHTQVDNTNPNCEESTAYPANPDSDYGWEKLFSERLYQAYYRNYGLDIKIARFHNIFGPESCYNNGKEKSPAAICRKVLQAENGEVEVWGDGEQTRSFLYIDECLDGVRKLMESDCHYPINIGSDEMISINNLIDMVAGFENKTIVKKHIDGPLGVRGRNSHNNLCYKTLGWKPSQPLEVGMKELYFWIKSKLNA